MFKGRVINRSGGPTRKFMAWAMTEAPTKCSAKGCNVISKGHDGYLQHWRDAHDKPIQQKRNSPMPPVTARKEME